jgi:hypothetical protein
LAIDVSVLAMASVKARMAPDFRAATILLYAVV